MRNTTYVVQAPEKIEGNNNRIYTAYDIEVYGDFNRIEATASCKIAVHGNRNTIYGNGDVELHGEGNVASSKRNNDLHFVGQEDKHKRIRYVSSGVPYAMIDNEIKEVVRFNKTPYEVISKTQTEIGDKTGYLCQLRLQGSDDIINGIIDYDGTLWKSRNPDMMKLKLIELHKYGTENTKEKIIQKVRETQRITVGEYILVTGACLSGTKAFIDKAIKEGVLTNDIWENGMAVQDVKRIIIKHREEIHGKYRDTSCEDFLREIGK